MEKQERTLWSLILLSNKNFYFQKPLLTVFYEAKNVSISYSWPPGPPPKKKKIVTYYLNSPLDNDLQYTNTFIEFDKMFHKSNGEPSIF